jgi:DNA-binding transcriptional LysR family regulator
MELQQLKYFKAVATIGKISDAADALFISAPALSTSISRLEKELGVRLFDRTSNRITLNAQGQIFLKHVNQVFSTLEHAQQELQLTLFQPGPHISLLSINTMMWVNLIAAFTSEFPRYTLSCSGISFSQIAENRLPAQQYFLLAFDCEIPPIYTDKLDSIALFRAGPMVMIHKDHPLAQKERLDVRELVNERLLLSMPSASLYQRLKQILELYNIPIPTDNFLSHDVRQKMVASNTAISFFSNYPGAVPHPDIRYIPLNDPFEPWNARLYWRKDHPLTEHEIAFRDFAEQFYRNMH